MNQKNPPKVTVVRPNRPNRQSPPKAAASPPPSEPQDYRAQAHQTINRLQNATRQTAGNMIDNQLRKRGIDPEFAKEVVLRGLALLEAVQERSADYDDGYEENDYEDDYDDFDVYEF